MKISVPHSHWPHFKYSRAAHGCGYCVDSIDYRTFPSLQEFLSVGTALGFLLRVQFFSYLRHCEGGNSKRGEPESVFIYLAHIISIHSEPYTVVGELCPVPLPEESS